MTRREALLLLTAQAAGAQERGDREGASLDQMYRALELLSANPPEEALRQALSLLRGATSINPGLLDAHHYRSLVEQKLGMTRQAAASRTMADKSEALQLGLDPFRLAAPPRPDRQAVPARQTAKVGRKWALAVGLGQFRSAAIAGLPSAAADAQAFTQFLLDPKGGRFQPPRVRQLLDKEATTANIKAELNRLARSVSPEDLVVLFLSSHGSPRRRDQVDGLNYIVTWDTDTSSDDALYGSALAMVELSDIVRTRVRARRVAIILDTCHSGGVVRRGNEDETGTAVGKAALNRIREGEGRIILASSEVSQRSWESTQLKNSFFTYYLLQALRADGATQPLQDLYPKVRDRVSAEVRRAANEDQTPVMSTSDNSEPIVLGAEETAA